MRQLLNLAHSTGKTLAAGTIITLFAALPCRAETDMFRGKAFSDPSVTQQMPSKWEKETIEHDASIDADLVISLDQQIYRVLLPAIKQYASNRNLKITVLDSTCGNAMGLLKRKKIDMGGLCCPPGKTDRLPGLRFHTLGITPIAIIVNPKNPISDITLDKARMIFTGKLFRWSELTDSNGIRGMNMPILTQGRLHCKKRPGHWRLLLDNEELFSPRLHVVGTIPDMIRMVSMNKNSIGHASLWLATEYYKDLGKIKVLRINGHDPSDLDSIISGDYSLYKTFNLAIWDPSVNGNPHVAGLVMEMSKEVERLDKKFMIVPSSRLRNAGWRFHGDELVGELER